LSVEWDDALRSSGRTCEQKVYQNYHPIQKMVVSTFNQLVHRCGTDSKLSRRYWQGVPLWHIIYSNLVYGPVLIGTTPITSDQVLDGVLASEASRLNPFDTGLEVMELFQPWKHEMAREFTVTKGVPDMAMLRKQPTVV